MENYKMIDYDHSNNGLMCNGNLSNIEGPFEAHWTFDQEGQLATATRYLTTEAFGLLWDGVTASVSAGGVFWKHQATDPTRLIDPDLHHVIAVLQAQDGWMRSRTFLVPSSEADPAFVTWLDALAAPGNTRYGGIVHTRKGHAVAGPCV